jgi:predicted RNA-binding protein Jag
VSEVVAAAPPVAPVEVRVLVEALLSRILGLMDYPARLDFRDMPDGALGVALHFEGGELPGITPGKRTYLVDCLQFLVNKALNRPNVPRRWVNLGVGGFPEPRQPQATRESPPKASPAPAAAAIASAPTAPPAAVRPAAGRPQPQAQRPQDKAPAHAPKAPHAPRGGHGDERTLEVAADPAWTKLGQSLAERSARLGRAYAVMMLPQEDRARLLQAAKATAGVQARPEGEGHWRRVTFMPDKLAPVSKKALMPDYDDEDEDE